MDNGYELSITWKPSQFKGVFFGGPFDGGKTEATDKNICLYTEANRLAHYQRSERGYEFVALYMEDDVEVAEPGGE